MNASIIHEREDSISSYVCALRGGYFGKIRQRTLLPFTNGEVEEEREKHTLTCVISGQIQ